MKGNKISLAGTVVSSKISKDIRLRKDVEDQKLINGKFEVGEKSLCQILTENGKKIILITNLPNHLIKTPE